MVSKKKEKKGTTKLLKHEISGKKTKKMKEDRKLVSKKKEKKGKA